MFELHLSITNKCIMVILTEPASMRKAPSLLSFSTDNCWTLGWGMVRSLTFRAPCGGRRRGEKLIK
jgi:hypothetical protein